MKIYPSSPVVGVGVVVFKDNLILLEKRGNEPGKGKWNLPGGTLKLGEKIFDCAKREVFEEAGIEIEPLDIVKVYELIEREGERIKFHYVIIDVVAMYISGRLRVQSDALDLKWVNIERVDGFPIPERVKDAIRRGEILINNGKTKR